MGTFLTFFITTFPFSASDVLKLYEDPLPIDAPDAARRNAVDKKNAELRGLFSEPPGGAKTASSTSVLPSISSSSVDELPISLSLDRTDTRNRIITDDEGLGVSLDTATDLSRSPWTQTASPFILEKPSTSSTISTKSPVAVTSADVNARRRAKEVADNKSVGVKSKQAESDNDVEWIVDAFSADTPENSEAAVRGMSSSGRSVNRRRMQQEQKKLKAAPQLNIQESRILKTRLDELRKANGLFVSEPINEDAEKKLIDFFK